MARHFRMVKEEVKGGCDGCCFYDENDDYRCDAHGNLDVYCTINAGIWKSEVAQCNDGCLADTIENMVEVMHGLDKKG